MKKGIDTAFGVTGGGAMFLNESFRKQKKLNFVFMHHEQSAAMAAESYYRVSRKPAITICNFGTRKYKCSYRCNWSMDELNPW